MWLPAANARIERRRAAVPAERTHQVVQMQSAAVEAAVFRAWFQLKPIIREVGVHIAIPTSLRSEFLSQC